MICFIIIIHYVDDIMKISVNCSADAVSDIYLNARC